MPCRDRLILKLYGTSLLCLVRSDLSQLPLLSCTFARDSSAVVVYACAALEAKGL